jgi:DNA mismatch repair ATPase MutL
MAHIRSLDPQTSDTVSACYLVSDSARALEIVIENALEANANHLEVICLPPYTGFTLSDNGCGIGINTLMRIGSLPVTTKRGAESRGNGLFLLSKVSNLSITSRSPISGFFKRKTLFMDGTSSLESVFLNNVEYTTLLEVTDLFANFPVRFKHCALNPGLQYRSIAHLMTSFAASHPTATFRFKIGDDPSVTLSPTTQFLRLNQLFSEFFSQDLPWQPIELSTSKVSINGIILSPSSLFSIPKKISNARLTFFRKRLVASPEIASILDTTWTHFSSYRPPVSKFQKQYPIYYIEIDGNFEAFRGNDSTTSLLRCNDFKSISKLVQEYLHQLFSESLTFKHTPTQQDENNEFSPQAFSPIHHIYPSKPNQFREELVSEAKAVKEMWQTRKIKKTLAPSKPNESIPLCRLPRNPFPSPSSTSILTVIGQVDKKFILAITASKVLYAFDQHAVHERIRFEFFLRKIQSFSDDIIQSKSMTPPQTLSISFSQYTLLNQMKKTLNEWCWTFELNCNSSLASKESFISYSVTIQSLPNVLDTLLEPNQLLTHSAEINSNAGSALVPSSMLQIIKSKACRGAIMFGDTLSMDIMTNIVHSLANCGQPFACAHGRTNVAVLTDV